MIIDVAAEKRAMRRELRARRRRLHGACHDAGHALARRVLLEIEPGSVSVVAGYWPDDGEIDPRPLMAAFAERGAVLALPTIERPGSAPAFLRWNPGEPLRLDRVGMPAPLASAPRVDPDLLLCPLVAFDADCRRLGRGGGYMDRALAALAPHARAVGLAWEGQRVCRVPTAAHDRVLDAVATERQVFRRTERLQPVRP